MRWWVIVYLAGYPFAVIAIAIESEMERRAAVDPAHRKAILLPALDGIVVGLVWPVLVAGALGLGLLWLIACPVRRLAARIDGSEESPDG